MRWKHRPWTALLAALPILAGCTVVKAGEGGVARTLVGVVRIELPPTSGQVSAIEARTFGLGWDAGPFLGYRGSNWIAADPAHCQLTVIIRSGTQAAQAARVLEQLKGENLCMADFTGSPAPVSR